MAENSSNESASGWKFPFRITIENRVDNPPKWLSPILSLGAVVVALLIGAVVIWLGGGKPCSLFLYGMGISIQMQIYWKSYQPS